MIGKIIELIFIQSKGNLIFGILIFLGLSSCLASKSLTSSVKEISSLIDDNITDQKTEQIVKEKVQRIVSRDVSTASFEHLLRSVSYTHLTLPTKA
mgnify:CR=1 FL=1